MDKPEIDISAMSRVLVPSGRDYERCIDAFEETFGVSVPRFTDRRLQLGDKPEYAKVKGKDIPAMVAAGYGDVGLVGTDVCEEQIPANPDDTNLRYQTIGKAMCTFNLLLPADRAAEYTARLGDLNQPPLVAATSFPRYLARCLQRARANGQVFNVVIANFVPSGSVEIAPELGVGDIAADLVETGETLGANNKVPGPELDKISPAMVWRDGAKPATPLGRLFGVDEALAERVAQIDNSDITSYTLERLRKPNLAVKDFGEEAAEYLDAVIRGDIAAPNELADLLFAALVLARANGQAIKLADVVRILENRRLRSSLQKVKNETI